MLLLLIGTTLTALDSILGLTDDGSGSPTLTPALYSYGLVVDGHAWAQATAAARLLLGVILLGRVAYTAAVGRPAGGARGAPGMAANWAGWGPQRRQPAV